MSQKLEIEGKLLAPLQEASGTGKKGPWRTKEFLISYGDKYPQELVLVAWNEFIKEMDARVGDKCTFSVEPSSKPNNQGKYFTNVKVWRVS